MMNDHAKIRQNICLCMIVKNEAGVIERCLQSTKSFVTSWLIVDTGSSDGTQQIIREFMKFTAYVPGTLFERPWVNFSHNRNEAIDLAQAAGADWVLVLDADDVLRWTHPENQPSSPPSLEENCYHLRVHHGPIEHHRPHLFRPDKGFRYVGELHEYLHGPTGFTIYPHASIQIIGGGNRSQNPHKFRDDALLLEKALRIDPTNSRNQFYLAQSWRDAGEASMALRAYEVRAAMTSGFWEEVFISRLEMAKIYSEGRHGKDDMQLLVYWMKAFDVDPRRAEPLYYLARMLRLKSKFAQAVVFADAARKLHKPNALFIEHGVYDWLALDEFAIAADWVPGRRTEAIEAGKELLRVAPDDQHERIRSNMEHSKRKLASEGS